MVEDKDEQQEVADTNISPPAPSDISKFLTMSDFRVDFTKRRRAVFVVTGFLGFMALSVMSVLLWGVYRSIERGQPVDPTIGNMLSGLITALFINVAAVIGGYLIVPAWESSNFRKNFGDVMKTLADSNTQRSYVRAQAKRED